MNTESRRRHNATKISDLKNGKHIILIVFDATKFRLHDYVTKPFSVRELILRVKVLLKKQRESLVENKLVTFGPIRIDLDAHELKINDKEIVLTALEFKLLQHLVKRKGRVQTREQLLGDVWGYSAEVTTRTVDTHIKRLREKLGNTSDYIQTIRGVGYRFSNVD